MASAVKRYTRDARMSRGKPQRYQRKYPTPEAAVVAARKWIEDPDVKYVWAFDDDNHKIYEAGLDEDGKVRTFLNALPVGPEMPDLTGLPTLTCCVGQHNGSGGIECDMSCKCGDCATQHADPADLCDTCHTRPGLRYFGEKFLCSRCQPPSALPTFESVEEADTWCSDKRLWAPHPS